MTIRESIASLFCQPLFREPPELSFAASALIEDDGVWIGQRKRGGRFVRYPDGQLQQVDRDFDAAVFDDPESEPRATEKAQADTNTIDVPDVEPATDAVSAIAEAMLAAAPSSLVAIYHDAKGNVLGTTVTRAKRGLTAAVFRAAFRSLPSRAKQVTFAAGGNVSTDVRDAATMAADAFLVRVLGFIIAD